MDRASGTDRARWLAELALALEQAQQLAWTLGVSEGTNSEARELYGRLEAVRIEVDSLRRGQWPQQEAKLDPKRMEFPDWPAPRRSD